MFVVIPLIDQAKPKAFRTAKGANEWAQTGAFAETGADKCEVHWVGEDLSEEQAIAAVKFGSSEKRATVHRRLSAAEIEELERRDAIADLRELGLWIDKSTWMIAADNSCYRGPASR